MRARNWVKFIILSVLVFVLVLVITYRGEIWNVVKTFPIDRVISFLIGAGVMFLANFKFNSKHKNTKRKQENEN